MCLPALNNKVNNDNCIQKRVFSFTFWFIKCLKKEMVQLALLAKVWHSQRKYSTVLNMVSVNIISQKLPGSHLMKISPGYFGSLFWEWSCYYSILKRHNYRFIITNLGLLPYVNLWNRNTHMYSSLSSSFSFCNSKYTYFGMIR